MKRLILPLLLLAQPALAQLIARVAHGGFKFAFQDDAVVDHHQKDGFRAVQTHVDSSRCANGSPLKTLGDANNFHLIPYSRRTEPSPSRRSGRLARYAGLAISRSASWLARLRASPVRSRSRPVSIFHRRSAWSK